MVIFEKTRGVNSSAVMPSKKGDVSNIPVNMLRSKKPILPEQAELDVVRHYTQLSRRNFCIDTNFYPLGSCTMKYNPRAAHKYASLAGFLERHPYASSQSIQGTLECLYDLEEVIKELTGMTGVSLAPMAGAQGEFAGVAMIKAYHQKRGDFERNEIIVPDAAHGTNPATAKVCGLKVIEIPTKRCGDIDLEALEKVLGPKTAGIMLTNPSTVGVFERNIATIAKMVHEVGGLLYYDGANLNAIMGKARPGDMGFDVLHMNLHKTFATPHGGGGPGSGPVAVNDKLKEFLPIPIVGKKNDKFVWLEEKDLPNTIGRLSAFNGNIGVLIRAYIYSTVLGGNGLTEASEIATLNANYMMARLKQEGFTIAYPDRRASHEFIVTLKPELQNYGVTATDFAKCLIDRGVHAPTVYFPLLVPECLLIEPTETENVDSMEKFIQAMVEICNIAKENPEYLKGAPYNLPSRRLDDVKAAKELDIVWSSK
ncbi:aminomethyl-transferring glycine dehydrogenase subunit GcvPB [Allofrancisella guangzhouensis]|uniref:Probable glycine dehydrogenase (decarboxylating) subunit 2 n=1 Tax=Allofrancisella guangzhouensis TaxID=594679 RepID=A0A0A8E6Q0_9GAMM|nr:aminomethyl-transferring glycine dehydrogenase subunit GcvPB [Allofrancisella guangzhouensis]AJC49277.1 glycine dehydrogenase [Allofrancisella guangzhouensis]MBK2027722.1 aminomethyl-transferring glycine dehydrogenase subunit GcvPB [Allofrancisella guangzhouensis]MBK2044005.1 aminomethyl-transferring glycine dehydrogenase subunit GcvPB [Allofrancisella guangzhouensis]MBK2046389.1 aminomethyl-transferring glycine dehydrogenase subunit GcvPB [Allofrancisella guangzhouensis]